jgi:hypothetical protein
VLSLVSGCRLKLFWYVFTPFVGLNLFQSAFTSWRPMMSIPRKPGVKS